MKPSAKIPMPLLENITKAEQALITEKESYNSILERLKSSRKKINSKKRKITVKYIKLMRISKTYNLNYNSVVNIIHNEAKKRNNEDFEKDLDFLTENSFDLDETELKNMWNSNEKNFNVVKNLGEDLFIPQNYQVQSSKTIIPIFSDKQIIFKDALDKIVKEIAAKRLMNLKMVENI